MLQRRTTSQCYSPQEIIHWLTWLAQKMTQNSQTVFLIENMQPGWLQTNGQRRLYIISTLLVIGLLNGLVMGLIIGLIMGGTTNLNIGLVSGFIGLFGGFSSILLDMGKIKSLTIKPIEGVKWSWRNAGIGLLIQLFKGMRIGMIVGLIGGLIIGFVVYDNEEIIKPSIIGDASLLGSPLSILLSTLTRWVFAMVFGLIGMLSVGLMSGLFSGLHGVVNYGLRDEKLEMKMGLNQGIRLSIKNAIIVGLSVSLYLTFVYWLGIWWFIQIIEIAPFYRLEVGLYFGLLFGLSSGGQVTIQHYSLRYMLWNNGHIPWNIVYFLDYCADRIFLRKVGGGYIFIHRYLMEYFASLEPEQAELPLKQKKV